jgi:hypothetical protein
VSALPALRREAPVAGDKAAAGSASVGGPGGVSASADGRGAGPSEKDERALAAEPLATGRESAGARRRLRRIMTRVRSRPAMEKHVYTDVFENLDSTSSMDEDIDSVVTDYVSSLE